MTRDARDFSYLEKTAAKCAELYLEKDFEAYLDRAGPEQLDELADAYLKIAAREDSNAISRWIDRCLEKRTEVPCQEFWFSRAVGQMLCFFDWLGCKNISPFSSGQVAYLRLRQPFDWSILPHSLKYLIPPAERFGDLATEAEMAEFSGQLDKSSADWNELARTADRIRANHDFPVIENWIRQYPLHEHRESAAVYSLLGVIDFAGLKLSDGL